MRIAVVDDHPVTLAGFVAMFEDVEGFDLVAAAASVEDLDWTTEPEVVVLDLYLSTGRSGADAVAHVCGRGPRVLVMSRSEEAEDVLDAIAAGAGGYISKHSQPSEIVAAVETVAAGGFSVSPTLAGYLLNDSRGESEESPHALTGRQLEVLALLARGEKDANIARELCVSVRTVHGHLEQIRDKTGRRRRPELTLLAVELGLVNPGDGPRQ